MASLAEFSASDLLRVQYPGWCRLNNLLFAVFCENYSGALPLMSPLK
jgi:hypothetical protein